MGLGVSTNQVAAAAAYSTGQRSRQPRITSARDQVRIIHRELISSVVGTTNFTQGAVFPLNPGLATSFPWLASQAQAWERYRFNSLKFEYFTRTGTQVPGSVMLVPDYDAADEAPISETVASSYEDVAEDAPWKDIVCTLRPAALHALGPTKFVRSGALGSNQDVKTYDSGNLFLFTTDGTAVNWGKLWVEYDVTLMTPQLNPVGASNPLSFHATGVTPTSASLLGTATTQPNSTPFVSVNAETITFATAGKFLVSYTVSGTTATIAGQPGLTGGGTYLPIDGFTGALAAGSGTASMTITSFVNVPQGGLMTFDNTIVAGTTSDLLVCVLPTGFQ